MNPPQPLFQNWDAKRPRAPYLDQRS
jgi:hypothetical protein